MTVELHPVKVTVAKERVIVLGTPTVLDRDASPYYAEPIDKKNKLALFL